MPQINLLPWREQARQAKRVMFGLMLGTVMVFAIFVLFAVHRHYSKLISYQQGRNAFITARIGIEQGDLNNLNKDKKQQEAILSRLQFIIALRLTNYKAVELLNYLTQVVPESVNFTKITRVGDKITVTGQAKSNLQITQLMKNIGNISIFQDPELSMIAGKEDKAGEERTFQLGFIQKQ